jgi:hypothetical protein
MLIFGGRNNSEYFNDLFILDLEGWILSFPYVKIKIADNNINYLNIKM